MAYVTEIEPRDFTAIPRLRESMMGLPKEVAVCSVHGEEVSISQSDWLLKPNSGAPFAKAVWTGFCAKHVDKVVALAWEAQ